MPVPAGYTLLPSGYYIRDADQSAPYVYADGVMTLRGMIAGPVRLADIIDRPDRLIGHATVDNFPGSFAVSNFPGSFSVSNFPTSFSVNNFPSGFMVAGTVAVSNFPATQPVSGTFWPATQPVSGSVSVSNFPNFPAVQQTAEVYTGGEALDDQVGAGAVLSFAFASPVQQVWVLSNGGASRANPFGGTPTGTKGIPCADGTPIPMTIATSLVKVWAPAGATVSVWGFRL